MSHTHRDRSLGSGYSREPFGDIRNTLNRLTRPLRNVFSRQKDKSSDSPKRDKQGDRSPTSPFRRFGSFRFNKKSPIKMDRLRRSFRDSFRRRKTQMPDTSRSIQWPNDEQAVRSSTCSFPIEYLGCIEVYEREGLDICEEAMNILKKSRRRPFRGYLHVNDNGLRVVDKHTKALILDQSIEKVSFCAAHRHHKHDFCYICRDGTTERWMCHGFTATKDPGERLSQAVGYAFIAGLERKIRYDTECRVRMTFDKKNSAFTRIGSFRQRTLTDRLHNERGVDVGKMTPAAIVSPQPIAQPKPHNPHAIERPHASPLMLERQGSCRPLSSINSQSPFKRRMSLRLDDLPSNVNRQRLFHEPLTDGESIQFASALPGEVLQPSKLQPMNQQTEMVAIAALSNELNQVSEMIAHNDTNFDTFIDDGTDLNFDMQSMLTSTATPDLVSSTNTISADVKPKMASVAPIELVSSSDVIEPLAASDIDEPINNDEVDSMSDEPCHHAISISSGFPSKILQYLPASNDNKGGCDISSTKSVATAIVPPNNAQLSTTNELVDQFLDNTTTSEANQETIFHSITEPLCNDPFDAEWVANVANIIHEADNWPITAELPIITNTNPFISPVEEIDSQQLSID